MSSSSILDGVVDPNGLLMTAIGPVFLAVIPITNYLTSSNGVVQKAISTLINLIPGNIPKDREIAALKDINNLTGLPFRLRSAHYNLIEMFPGFALSAALTQSLAPKNQSLINLLGFHVLLKCFVYYPAYVLDVAPVRSFAHLGATASVINVAWILARGAR
ncbi:hypothetical protein BDZ45DRAFT_747695 [Acephala macrosclerotiorum]|nr:hypothetical protein BDZ45DRAFT_747695 [Acephala macrosclerotiorum]